MYMLFRCLDGIDRAWGCGEILYPMLTTLPMNQAIWQGSSEHMTKYKPQYIITAWPCTKLSTALLFAAL